MPTASTNSLQSRRNPSQARSIVTVDSIFEASILVLLDEPGRLTTTKVAERAGVSIGTLYQYFPNKQALLNAILERHLAGVAHAVETAARQAHRKPLAHMVETVVQAFVKAKFDRVDEARALYAVAAELGCEGPVKNASARVAEALAAMLSSAPDAGFDDLMVTSFMFGTAMVGPTREVLENRAPPQVMNCLPGQLVSLCLGYLEQEATASMQPRLKEASRQAGRDWARLS